ncbi:hypothetical protein ABGV42_00330 [Paenibacillus pabuli]|uniref:hypothetical protein n=1 Tax=Paenibacillus pabuli TaxID=1472 RepID=UPI0032422B6F
MTSFLIWFKRAWNITAYNIFPENEIAFFRKVYTQFSSNFKQVIILETEVKATVNDIENTPSGLERLDKVIVLSELHTQLRKAQQLKEEAYNILQSLDPRLYYYNRFKLDVFNDSAYQEV